MNAEMKQIINPLFVPNPFWINPAAKFPAHSDVAEAIEFMKIFPPMYFK